MAVNRICYPALAGAVALSAALRSCMNRNGKNLSAGCVNALVQSGEVSQAEVNRRKKAAR